jgi:hypothetical protein
MKLMYVNGLFPTCIYEQPCYILITTTLCCKFMLILCSAMKNNMLQNNRFKFFNELKIVQMYILGYIFDMHGFSV